MRIALRLLLITLLLGLYIDTYAGCATFGVKPTGDNLCTEQCRKDYPTPDGFELIGRAGPNNGKEMVCKCYKRPLSEKESSLPPRV